MRILFVLLGVLLVGMVGVMVFDPFAENLPNIVQTVSAPPAEKQPEAEAKVTLRNIEPNLSFDLIQVSPDGMAVIAGQAIAGAKISVLDGDTVIGEVVADAAGSWVLNPTTPLQPGNRTIGLKMQPPSGGTVIASKNTALVLVPERGKGQPATVAMIDGKTGATRILQRANNFDGIAIDLLEQPVGKPAMLRGQANKPGIVRLYAGESLLGEASPDTQGQWAIAIPQQVDLAHLTDLRADLLAVDGKVVSRAAVNIANIMADQGQGDSTDGKIVVIRLGNNLWRIAMAAYGDGFQYRVIFEANKGQIKDPDLIYPGQVFSLPSSIKDSSKPIENAEKLEKD